MPYCLHRVFFILPYISLFDNVFVFCTDKAFYALFLTGIQTKKRTAALRQNRSFFPGNNAFPLFDRAGAEKEFHTVLRIGII